MIQLIIDSEVMPEALPDTYQCPEVQLGQQVEMISGRWVMELRGLVYKPTAQYDYIMPETWRHLRRLYHSGAPFTAAVLPDNSTDGVLIENLFFFESLTPPKFFFDEDGVGYWHDLQFTLREAEPHD